MTIEKLQEFLIVNSPFKFKGSSKELYYFGNNYYSINEGKKNSFKLSKTEDDFILIDMALIPVFQNVKIIIEYNKVVKLNINLQKRKNDTFRNEDAEDGYLILQSYKIK